MIKVGCCGYPTSMKKYQEIFGLVELNTTFYRYPKTSTVVKWREKAPEKFEFTVKANQDISHKFKFKSEPSVKAFEQMKEICKALRTRILLIQTPGSFRPDKLKDAHEFLSKINHEGLVVVWETRGPSWDDPHMRERLAKLLQELEVSHVTDPFRAMPTYTSDVAYFRLHGLGERMYYYQYTDAELKRLHQLVEPLEAEGKQIYVLFNNLSMFDDALRFMRYLETNSFPSLTGTVGLESVKSVMEKTRYPATKSVLLKKLGWRLVEVEEGKQVKLNELLKGIPSKTYGSVEEVLREIKL
ncbi:MAG: hypothetical protein AOA66_1269 [Candidatus Bathyarchaeota archaeon BA2]|nr:MAG: hypothetical protein AOA66_1269 [Candidatus Bathyarchaeota archaeon BA2]